MKQVMTALLVVLCAKSSAQVIADPALSDMNIRGVNGTSIIASNISMDSIIQLKIPIANTNLVNNLPSGTCKIKIGLGSKLELLPGFDLTTINTNAYFNWSAVMQGGQVQLTGDLVAPVPFNYADTVILKVKGSIVGNSTITTNFLITNHNTVINLSDENPTNNTSFLPYSIVAGSLGPVPVTFTRLQLSKQECNIKINFTAENEINVDRFEYQLSANGRNFYTVGQVTANALVNYSFLSDIADSLRGGQVFVRIKSVDKDDKFQYSETKSLSGLCEDANQQLEVFPSPATSEISQLTIQQHGRLFNGNYVVTLLDVSGKTLSIRNFPLANTPNFKFDIGGLSAGQYILKITPRSTGKSIAIKWIRL